MGSEVEKLKRLFVSKMMNMVCLSLKDILLKKLIWLHGLVRGLAVKRFVVEAFNLSFVSGDWKDHRISIDMEDWFCRD